MFMTVGYFWSSPIPPVLLSPLVPSRPLFLIPVVICIHPLSLMCTLPQFQPARSLYPLAGHSACVLPHPPLSLCSAFPLPCFLSSRQAVHMPESSSIETELLPCSKISTTESMSDTQNVPAAYYNGFWPEPVLLASLAGNPIITEDSPKFCLTGSCSTLASKYITQRWY